MLVCAGDRALRARAFSSRRVKSDPYPDPVTVRADFTSIKDVELLLVDGKIYINQMTHAVRPYYKPLRINKCMKCFHHDHKTKECPNQQLCARCGEQHNMSNGCERQEKCANCSSDQHSVGHPSCPIIQRIRKQISEQQKRYRAELIIERSSQQQNYDYHSAEQFPALDQINQVSSIHQYERYADAATGNQQTINASFYSPPDEPIPKAALTSLLRFSNNLIIVGDFNAKHPDWQCPTINTKGRQLSEWLDGKNLEIRNSGMKTSLRSDTTIDLIISTENPPFVECHTLPYTGSDHLPVL
ncbi:unnamed protein product, partial [Didymodactylos carnosus]